VQAHQQPKRPVFFKTSMHRSAFATIRRADARGTHGAFNGRNNTFAWWSDASVPSDRRRRSCAHRSAVERCEYARLSYRIPASDSAQRQPFALPQDASTLRFGRGQPDTRSPARMRVPALVARTGGIRRRHDVPKMAHYRRATRPNVGLDGSPGLWRKIRRCPAGIRMLLWPATGKTLWSWIAIVVCAVARIRGWS